MQIGTLDLTESTVSPRPAYAGNVAQLAEDVAALVDGASVPRQFFQIIMPLCRPALAALATLEFTWLYNDFFWAVVLINQGSQRPITSSIANLGGQYFSNDNLIAAASMMIALPTLAVYLMLQKQFISGLTLGSTKG